MQQREVDIDRKTDAFLQSFASDSLKPLKGTAPEGLQDQYSDELRAIAVQTWLGRMINEHRSSNVFAGMLQTLIEASCALDAQSAVLTMAQDELRHAVLCGNVVRALGTKPVMHAEPELRAVPRYEAVPTGERVLRQAIAVGCLSETVAVALISEERALATEPLIKWTLDKILADEVTHAKLGWSLASAFAPTLDEAGRLRTERYLCAAFAHLESNELPLLASKPVTDSSVKKQREALGLCEGDGPQVLFADTVASVIIPGLEKLGLDAQRCWKERKLPV
jgi:hypothetical protein